MKKHLFVLCLIILVVFALSFLVAYQDNKRYLEKDYDWTFIIMLPLVFLLVPAFILGLILAKVMGQFKRPYLLKYLLGTNLIALAVALYFTGKVYYKDWYFEHYRANISRNEFIKNKFKEGRDSIVLLAIEAIEKRQKDLNGYGILSIAATPRDTLISINPITYYVVDQVYFIGAKATSKNMYVAKQLVFPDKDVQEVFNVQITKDNLALPELSRIKTDFIEIRDVLDTLLTRDDEKGLRELRDKFNQIDNKSHGH